MMVTVAEMHKKMIRTVIRELTPVIQQYSESDQVLIQEFLDLLGFFEEAEIKRTHLVNRFRVYN